MTSHKGNSCHPCKSSLRSDRPKIVPKGFPLICGIISRGRISLFRVQTNRNSVVKLSIDIRVEMEVEFGVGISEAVLEVAYSLVSDVQVV